MSTWEQIPETLRPELLRIARKAGGDLKAQIRSSGDQGVAEMVKRKLNV